MKRLLILSLILAFAACNRVPAAGQDESPLANKSALTKAECREYAAFLENAWRDSVKAAETPALEAKVIKRGQYTMRLDWKIFGNKPADGRSLYISLHGGGGGPASMNDQQWANQLTLYQPAEGVYLCPRAITDTWDLHFRPESDAFYEEIIRMAVACLDVNPDKVYLMGYSAGGDGVWRLAPRMADHWAAASMMAGHPGDVSLLSLRNLPFMIWCGALDAAYNRNEECAKRIEEMDALQAEDPEGYVHEGHIVEGREHWMYLDDAAAVPWMARFRRNTTPDRVVWCQGDEPKEDFYWLGAPAGEIAKGKVVRAQRSGNTVEILDCDYSSLTLWLNDAMFNLDKPLTVTCGDQVLFEGTVERSPEMMRSTLKKRGDLSYIFPSSITVQIP